MAIRPGRAPGGRRGHPAAISPGCRAAPQRRRRHRPYPSRWTSGAGSQAPGHRHETSIRMTAPPGVSTDMPAPNAQARRHTLRPGLWLQSHAASPEHGARPAALQLCAGPEARNARMCARKRVRHPRGIPRNGTAAHHARPDETAPRASDPRVMRTRRSEHGTGPGDARGWSDPKRTSREEGHATDRGKRPAIAGGTRARADRTRPAHPDPAGAACAGAQNGPRLARASRGPEVGTASPRTGSQDPVTNRAIARPRDPGWHPDGPHTPPPTHATRDAPERRAPTFSVCDG